MNTSATATVAPNTNTVEQNVEALGSVCHVCETSLPYALVHATPDALVRIIRDLKFTVGPAKKGGDYYVVRVAPEAATTAPTARPVVAAVAQAPVAKPAPAADPGRINIQGKSYVVRETGTKRNQDARRWEVRKVGDEMGKPYVVTFQDHDGCEGQCSCPDWIYRRHQRSNPDCKHVTAFKAAFGRKSAVA